MGTDRQRRPEEQRPEEQRHWQASDLRVERAGQSIRLTAPCGQSRHFKPEEVLRLIAKLAKALEEFK